LKEVGRGVDLKERRFAMGFLPMATHPWMFASIFVNLFGCFTDQKIPTLTIEGLNVEEVWVHACPYIRAWIWDLSIVGSKSSV